MCYSIKVDTSDISGCGAVGSALDWGSRGREFKSRHSDQIRLIVLIREYLKLSTFFFLQKCLRHKAFRQSDTLELFHCGLYAGVLLLSNYPFCAKGKALSDTKVPKKT